MESTAELNTPTIDLIDLCESNPALANDIISNSPKYPCIQKKELEGIPASIFTCKPLCTTHLNKIVTIKGSVIKAYQVLFKNVISEQMCLKCNESCYITEADMSKKKGNVICQACGSTNSKISHDFQGAISSQSIRIQDIGNPRSMSETIEVMLEGNDAGKFIPGDKVSVTGIVFRKWKPLRVNEPMISTLSLKSLSITREEDDKIEFFEIKHLIDNYMAKDSFMKRSFILKSFSDDIYGILHVKLGLLLALVGGTNDNAEGSSTRCSSHVLLVGDPGTGKSHLLKIVSKLISPAIITNGVGTSDAGLTSCAVKAGKDWALEAGALVLADMGICCIDEFNRLKLTEKSGLLESMEQQTISIAKAGIVTSLNTRCSVIAASSTRYNYDTKKTVSENLGMTTPLVSRFDLIFGLFDTPNKDTDLIKADKIFSRDIQIKMPEENKWSTITLKSFIFQCRKKKNKINEGCCGILLKYYTKKRKFEGNSEFNTIRMLESLVRLSEAHSKLMNEDCVSEEDVYMAIILMETCINSTNIVAIDTDKVFTDKEYFMRIKTSLDRAFLLKSD
jgi:DNA helicase MCM9